MTFNLLLLLAGTLIITSIIIAKLVENIGVPTLLMFITVGILAGSEGPGGIHFEDYNLSQSVGIVALIFILFAGGLETDWTSSKKIFLPAFSLSTLGVILTAAVTGVVTHLVLGTDLYLSLLIGAIISSTDASAIFSILRMKKVSLKGDLRPLLELESGSNDPMAVFLTIAVVGIINNPETTGFSVVLVFLMEMSIGAASGFLLGKLMVYINNRLKFLYEGIYPVFIFAFCIFIYGFTVFIHGSGFLAVYIAGITASNSHFIYKRGMIRFFDGLAVLSQLVMFLTLGLLVFPSNLIQIYPGALVVSGILIFLARPIGVFLSLIPFKYNWKQKVFISWVGLRGAVPIILAIFPLLAGIPKAMEIFNVVFFVVIISVVLQGWTLNGMAKILGLSLPTINKKSSPLEFNPVSETNTELLELVVPFQCEADGRQIVDLNFPPESRIVLIYRNDQSIIPEGNTVIFSGDVLMILVNKLNIDFIQKIFQNQSQN